MTGMNVDPLNGAGHPDPETLRRFGIRWVRIVSRSGVEPYIQWVRENGIMVLAVITEQSKGYWCPADVYQIGNEPDVAGTADSRTPADYVAYWNLYRNTMRDQGVTAPLIGAGMGDGQVSYWQSVVAAGGLVGAAGFAVHPYNKTPAQAKTMLAAYQKVTPTLPLWVTEYKSDDIVGFAFMLRNVAAMSARFCWSDGMVQGFGLTDTDARILGAAS